jgi:hypothetical protein
MATLVLTVAASADDAKLNDVGYAETNQGDHVGGTGAATANMGYGWRFLNVTLGGGDIINAAFMKLMKSTTQFQNQNDRWTGIDEDNTATFSSGSPPGARAITSVIVAENHGINHVDGTVYNLPTTSQLQTDFGGIIQEIIDRAGWVSGNALGIVDNSDQDASADTSFSRKEWYYWDSSVASSEPQLSIDYSPLVYEQEGFRWRNDDGSESAATWAAAQDVNITAPRQSRRRLRILINTTLDAPSNAYRLEYNRVGDNDWRVVS